MANETQAATTLILLGASNLTLAWPRLMAVVEQRFPAQRNVYTAHGMGRSFLADRSAFGIRQLPGILKSSLWDGLRQSVDAAQPPRVLITDLGNDLVYGSSPEEVAAAADECIQRLKAWRSDCRFVMTRPPVQPVSSLGPLRFSFFRRVLFPTCRLTLPSIKSQTVELDARVQELAARHDIPLFLPDPAWYGLDPIHVMRRFQSTAFGQAMELWGDETADASGPSGAKHPRPTADVRWVWGRERKTPQPVETRNGTRVFAY
ncbi:hypothetical protein [Fuerstiella marisgermanici]|uniref:SGNH hydrolase-type esterase domain-containing protein n=1 Tax=Fuerstiella marisgermanici TaxID=1891926 RepID=A0A1P8WBK2_9PLAN|nr:hypothetical protein [Fuerstiella marisgermanici]APZ91447.1 hypothetical protein Fuma_01035 [Fuerstiella marisgermanici]